MALYLNLYHEIQKKKLNRQRDPVKLAIMGALVVAVGMAGWYFYRLGHVSALQRQAGSVISDLQKFDPQIGDAQKRHDAYEQDIKLADAIVHKIENRFYWAPLLEQIIAVVPPEVQVTALDGAVSSDGLKKITLTLTGVATGQQPRAVAEELRINLKKELSAQYHEPSAVFRSLEDGVDPVKYQGKSLPTALFVIDVTFTSPDVSEEGKPKTPVRVPKT